MKRYAKRAPTGEPGLYRVAFEGVDSSEQARLLRELGCDEVQGNLLSPAVPADELDALLQKIHERRW